MTSAPQYYTVMIVLSVMVNITLSLCIGLTDIYDKKEKLHFIRSFLVVALAAILEWTADSLAGFKGNVYWFRMVLKAAEFSLVPTVFLSWVSVIYRGKRLIAYRIIAGLNAVLIFSTMFTEAIFYVDENNLYTHGDFYWMYEVVASLFILIYAVENLVYFAKIRKQVGAGSLITITIFLFLSLSVKRLFPEVRFDWLVITISYCMFFVFNMVFRQREEFAKKQEELNRKLELEKMVEIKNEMVVALEKIYDAVYILDVEEDEVLAVAQDHKAESIFKNHCTLAESIDTLVGAFVAPESVSDIREFCNIDTVQDRMEVANAISLDILLKSGIWERETICAIDRDASGYVTKIMFLAQEIGGEKEKELKQQQALREATAAALLASSAKTSFLSNMSHDIRTPMNAVMGFATIAAENLNDREKVEDSIGKIISSCQHLNTLINEILDMSRIESGKETVHETETSIDEIVEKVSSIIEVQAREKNIHFVVDTKSLRHHNVYADTLKLSQVFINLLGNAVKFTAANGTVVFKVNQYNSAKKGCAVYSFKVTDTGIGMSPEFAAKAFEPFERERTSTVAGTTGTGLGLAITKNIVELMGGSIDLSSKVGQGTTFVVQFTLKLRDDKSGTANAKTEKDEEAEIPNSYFKGRRILVVEDNDLNREICIELLESAGFEIEGAKDGQQAVEMATSSSPGYYDAILMDIQMPIMDGYQATREIRNNKRADLAKIPIIATTANAFEEDRKRALETGMNDHVPKPIDFLKLKTVLARYL